MQEFLGKCCLGQPGTTEDFQPEWEARRFFIGGKMYAMIGAHKNGRPIITLKGDPLEAPLLRERYRDVIPGYYMNKTHWNSVYLDGAVPKEELERLVQIAYRLVLGSLPKGVQARLAAGGGQ